MKKRYETKTKRKKVARRRKKMIEGLIISAIVSIVIGGVIYFVQKHDAEVAAEKVKADEEKTYWLEGRLDNGKADPNEMFEIQFGNIVFPISYAKMAHGFNLREKFNLGYDWPVAIKLDGNGNLLVSAIFKDKNEKLIAHIVENQWKINKGNYYDRNFSLNTLEVVDKDKTPILQVGIRDGNNVFINGTFYFPNQILYVSKNQTIFSADPNFDKSNGFRKMKRMFKYPGNSNLGVEENSESQ